MHFEKQNTEDLKSIEHIEGPGIYSLFYSGDMDVYQSITRSNRPIYAGKAIPPESRKGGSVNTNHPALLRRIKEHAKSIDSANNLNTEDFSYRYLAVVPVWITLAERFLIEYYKPVWNLCLDGFGNHDPGSGRRNSRRSWWDTLHPGREWASRLTADKKQEDAEDRVRQFFLASRPQEEKSDE